MKMKNRIFILLLTLLGTASNLCSQYAVLNTFSQTGTRYQDCWNASITNPNGAQSVYAELEITSASKVQLKAISEYFSLKPGINTLDFTKITIKQVLINTNAVLWNEFVTFGTYNVCLRVYCFETSGSAEGCASLSVMPVSPLVIITPENGAQVGSLPVFSWAPPVPMNIFRDICYSIKVVPVYEGQSSYDAMLRNNPVVNEPCLKSLSWVYDFNSYPLEEGMTYAWQVTAMDQGNDVGKSEINTITIQKEEHKPKPYLIPQYYYKLRKTEDGNFGTAKGCLGFTCEQEKLELKPVFKIFDNKNKELSAAGQIPLRNIGEENYFILELTQCNAFTAGQTYRLEVLGKSGTRYLLYFKYAEPEMR